MSVTVSVTPHASWPTVSGRSGIESHCTVLDWNAGSWSMDTPPTVIEGSASHVYTCGSVVWRVLLHSSSASYLCSTV